MIVALRVDGLRAPQPSFFYDTFHCDNICKQHLYLRVNRVHMVVFIEYDDYQFLYIKKIL
jgi:hypothetical protein